VHLYSLYHEVQSRSYEKGGIATPKHTLKDQITLIGELSILDVRDDGGNRVIKTARFVDQSYTGMLVLILFEPYLIWMNEGRFTLHGLNAAAGRDGCRICAVVVVCCGRCLMDKIRRVKFFRIGFLAPGKGSVPGVVNARTVNITAIVKARFKCPAAGKVEMSAFRVCGFYLLGFSNRNAAAIAECLFKPPSLTLRQASFVAQRRSRLVNPVH